MKKADRQYIVDEIYRHFVTEGNPAGTSNGECHYHNEHDGQDYPCAIGLFDTKMILCVDQLGDIDAYSTIEGFADNDPTLLPEIFGIEECTDFDVQFLKFVQHAHDRSTDKPDFRQALIAEIGNIAYAYALVNPHTAT